MGSIRRRNNLKNKQYMIIFSIIVLLVTNLISIYTSKVVFSDKEKNESETDCNCQEYYKNQDSNGSAIFMDLPYHIEKNQTVNIEYYSENYYYIDIINSTTGEKQRLNVSVWDIMDSFYSLPYDNLEYDQYGRPIRPPNSTQFYQYVCITHKDALEYSCIRATLIG
jgi:hypothetical protein